ncbi:carboxypeptidase regulatory-like domain-containing protein [Jidongwangia harbinensis]|uniref:carboxypeptidase regulatory-like domain-containing protein n=1 Tax=Jidongwangia harbinensis TaxID=2878561 RepID=UPI001CD9A0DD|nr:carboxypeptidase-like regulatory domain-containing protein [Jidongwangia harbinensis]MCA2217422.1 carboxypeptidase-like regulatory domain-containing protein [Jidongwangia harbinensis]
MIRRILAAATAGLLAIGGWANPVQAAATGTVTGTFRSAEGEPVNGALVSAFTTANRVITVVLTGADGRYRMDAVPAGPVKLKFDRNNLVQWAHQAPDFASAALLEVAAGETIVADETQLPAGTIRGTVSAPAGGPATEFSTYAYPEDGTAPIRGDTLADGRYSISVPAGRWRVGVSSDVTGFQYVPQVKQRENATVFTVETGQAVVADETLLPLGAVQGTLEYSGGRPVVERSVKLWRDDTVVSSQFSGDDGSYYFRGLEPGEYLVSWENSDHTQTYVPGTLHRDQADRIPVRAGETTTANTRDVESAVVRGTLTTADGAPVPNAFVLVKAVAGGRSYADVTGRDGTWEVDNIDPENYRISFENNASDVTQYAYGTASADQARVFALAPGSTTTVDDTWVLGNTLRVTATDAADGGPADGFCVSVGTWSGYCTDSAVVTIPGLAAGPTTIRVLPLSSSDYLPSGPVPVTVAEGGTTPLTVPLTEGGRVSVEVVDRATGTGQKQWCVVLVSPGEGGKPRGGDSGCTHRNGRLTTYAVPAGTYQMFVRSTAGLSLGAQWVGENGGTGDQKEAATFKVKVGKTTKRPQVLLDPSGEIRGTLRDPAGAPMPEANVDLIAWPLGTTPPYQDTFPDGSYRIYALGPYQWPIVFTPKGGTVPRQMSGGTGNRFQAERITVQPKTVTTYDATLSAGSTLTGTVTVAPGRPSFTGGRITAVNAATGDVLAVADFTGQGGTYRMPIIGGGAVLLRWSLNGGPAASGSWPDKVTVPKSGTKTLDLTIG